jgi:hypothetical protein
LYTAFSADDKEPRQRVEGLICRIKPFSDPNDMGHITTVVNHGRWLIAVIHSFPPGGFEIQVSGVGCQVSGERKVRVETQNLFSGQRRR